MSSKIERAQRLSSAKTSVDSKSVKVEGFATLVEDIRTLAAANQQSNEKMSKQLNQLSQVILTTGEKGADMSYVIEAIDKLREEIANKVQSSPDYVITFDRDRNGLMKSGIELKSAKRTLN